MPQAGKKTRRKLANGSIIVRSRGRYPNVSGYYEVFAGEQDTTSGDWLDLSSEVAYVSYVWAACRMGCSDGDTHHSPHLSQHPDHARGRFNLPQRHRIPDAEGPSRSIGQDEEDHAAAQNTGRAVRSNDPGYCGIVHLPGIEQRDHAAITVSLADLQQILPQPRLGENSQELRWSVFTCWSTFRQDQCECNPAIK